MSRPTAYDQRRYANRGGYELNVFEIDNTAAADAHLATPDKSGKRFPDTLDEWNYV